MPDCTKDKKIKVNDIVKMKDEPGETIVTNVCKNSGLVFVMWKDGSCGDYEPSELENTGKTAKGLDLLLQQLLE